MWSRLGQRRSSRLRKVFSHKQLANGLTIIAEIWPDAHSIALGAFVGSGARDDALGGSAHFLEHLCFKGQVGQSAQEVSAGFDAIGARVDAFTTQELTAYTSATLPQFQTDLLEKLTGLLRPALRPADIDVERLVILEELAMYRDDPGSVLFDAAQASFYQSHPLGRSVLGTQASLELLDSGALQAQLQDWYAPNRVTIVACGRVDWEALVAQISSLTADWQPSRVQRQYPPLTPSTGGQHLTLSAARAQAALLMPGFAANDPRCVTASVLAQIIGDANSHLYWALVDDGLCDEASLEHTGEDGSGAFYGSISTDPDDLPEAIERYRAVLSDVQDNGVTMAELSRTKKKLEVSLALRFETPASRLLTLAEDWLALNEYRSVADLLIEVRGVTLEHVNALLGTRPFDHPCIMTLEPIQLSNPV